MRMPGCPVFVSHRASGLAKHSACQLGKRLLFPRIGDLVNGLSDCVVLLKEWVFLYGLGTFEQPSVNLSIICSSQQINFFSLYPFVNQPSSVLVCF